MANSLPKPDFNVQPGDDHDHAHEHHDHHHVEVPAGRNNEEGGKKCRLERSSTPEGPLCFNEPECQDCAVEIGGTCLDPGGRCTECRVFCGGLTDGLLSLGGPVGRLSRRWLGSSGATT